MRCSPEGVGLREEAGHEEMQSPGFGSATDPLVPSEMSESIFLSSLQTALWA